VRRWRALAGIVAVALLAAHDSPALSATGALEATVKDDRGAPVLDAILTLTPVGAGAATPHAATAVMDQQNKEFVPSVLPVPVGTAVTFPNRDNIRHHVYSFSSPKRFELPLYIGTPAAPVVFDKPGVVVLGCNIHDWMVGYIYVVATPYFGRTAADGRITLADVPPGSYEARIWHPRMRGESEKTARPTTITSGEPAQIAFALTLKPERKPAPRPAYDAAPQS
jgi:plastocyanin